MVYKIDDDDGLGKNKVANDDANDDDSYDGGDNGYDNCGDDGSIQFDIYSIHLFF